MEQLAIDSIPEATRPTRSVAREAAMAAARARAEQGMSRAERRAERMHAGWCATALDALRRFAASQHGMWTIETARSVIEQEIPKPSDGRAWGIVVVRAIKAGFIVKTSKTDAAASSNGAQKPMFAKGRAA